WRKSGLKIHLSDGRLISVSAYSPIHFYDNSSAGRQVVEKLEALRQALSGSGTPASSPPRIPSETGIPSGASPTAAVPGLAGRGREPDRPPVQVPRAGDHPLHRAAPVARRWHRVHARA